MNYNQSKKLHKLLTKNRNSVGFQLIPVLLYIHENNGATIADVKNEFEICQSTAESWMYSLCDIGRRGAFYSDGLGLLRDDEMPKIRTTKDRGGRLARVFTLNKLRKEAVRLCS